MPVSVQRRTWAFGAGLARAAGGNPLALDPERPSRDLPESDAALNWARTAALFCSFNGLLVAMFSLVGGGGDFGGGGEDGEVVRAARGLQAGRGGGDRLPPAGGSQHPGRLRRLRGQEEERVRVLPQGARIAKEVIWSETIFFRNF